MSLDGLTGAIAPSDAAAWSDDGGASGDDSGNDSSSSPLAPPATDGGGGGWSADAGGPADSSSAVDSSSAMDSSSVVDSSPPPPPTCGSGQIVCNGSCVDPTSDPHNCNGCGHVCASGVCGSSIVANMSSQPAGWSFNGTAKHDWAQSSAVLTAGNVVFQAGTVVYANPVAFDAFTAKFQFRMGYGGGTRSDGMGFMFQTTGPSAVGGTGGALAMDGLAGYGVELDIYNNGGCGDGSDDHVGVDSLAACSAMSGLPQSLFATDVSSTLDLADGHWHAATVVLAAGAVSLVIDGVGLAKGVNLPGFDPNTPAYLGFAGATGGLVDSTGNGGYRSEVKDVSITFPSPRCL